MPTGINYLDEVWNAITGCSGKGCKAHCWSRDLHNKRHKAYLNGARLPFQYARPFDEVQFFPERLEKPLHWKKPRRVGVCFTGDLFDEQVPSGWVQQIWQMIKATPWHTYFILTKQSQNAVGWWKLTERPILDNLFWGVSITDQEDADRMIQVQGKHWVSYEPALGHVDFTGIRNDFPYKLDVLRGHEHFLRSIRSVKKIDWLVIGCESGPKRRPMPLEWAYDAVEQGKAANVPVWVKQLDINGKCVHGINQFPKELQVRQWP